MDQLEAMLAINIILVVGMVAIIIIFFNKVSNLERRHRDLDNYICSLDSKFRKLEIKRLGSGD